MLISYDTALIQDICFNSSAAIKHIGSKAAKLLQVRHSDILAASNIFDLPIGNITFNRNECRIVSSDILSLAIVPNYRLDNENDLFDWETVERVKIVGINNVR